MLKVARDTDALQAPLGLMSAQFGEVVVRPQALGWVLFFFRKMGDRSDKMYVCTQGAPLLVTVDWAQSSEGQNFTFWGSCHSTSSGGTQHFWQGITYFLWAKSCRRLMNTEGENTCSTPCKGIDFFLPQFQSIGRFELRF